ncbi:MAG TPA: hypothetical protein VFZ12_05115 [Dehalococcoidia bacterium]|nr:hypothetical protein [Dehalococcoidia bacterium]
MVTRDDVHRLVDRLPESELEKASSLLRGLDPDIARLLERFEEEDEELSEEGQRALADGLADSEAGRVLTADEVKRRLKL